MPTEEETYRNSVREDIKNAKNILELTIRTNDKDYRDSLARIELQNESIETQVKFTNGKVRKIIIALFLVFGILIGQNFTNTHDIIQLIASIGKI
jgi:hypothetical protein